jgi:hypothetical protein
MFISPIQQLQQLRPTSMIIESVTNPVWANAEHTLVKCTVKVGHFDEPVQFTASPNDVEAHGREIYAGLVAGVYGEISEYVAPPAPPPAPPVTKESLMRELAMLTARIEALDSGTGAANTQPAVTGADTL